MVSQAFEAPI